MRTNRHHLWWEKRSYQTRLERTFRELPCQIVVMDVMAHRLLHVHTAPPEKPSKETMKDFIDRHNEKECGCYRR